MTANPEVIRAEPHDAIGSLIQQNTTPLLERWSQRAAAEQPGAERVHRASLLDHLPDLLWEIGQSLAANDAEEARGHWKLARKHGQQRWETGWSLVEVVRDYQILRLVLLEFLEEALDRPLAARETMALGLALDEAISSSVSRYVGHQEEHLRRMEQQRLEQERQYQEALRRHQTEALQETNRRKDEFLALLGHELRNPLAPLSNALEVLRRRGNDAPTRNWVEGVLDRQVKQMARLVDDLLDASRIGRGKVSLRKEALDLVALVRSVAEDHRPLLEAAGAKLEMELPGEPVNVTGDPARIIQVLGNLLSNATKFNQPGGRVLLTLRRETDPPCAVLTVSDSGIGISPDMLGQVFDMFVQEERGHERSRSGLGLGLALVKGLVELHGGRVAADSAGPGNGASFTCWFPLESDS